MKKIVKIIAVLIASLFLLASCNKYVCPAYTNADVQEVSEVNS